MLTVRWVEDREGCLLANWYDDERAEHGGFAETFVALDDDLVRRSGRPDWLQELLADCADDEDCEEPALAHVDFALAGRR